MTKPRNDRPLAKARRRLTRLEKHPPKPTSAAILPGVAAARAKDWDQVTTPTTHRINERTYGPGLVRAQPGIIATIRETDSRRRELRLDPRTDLPDPPTGPPTQIRPIRMTGVGPGEPVSPWEAEWRTGQAAEFFAEMSQRERRPAPPGPCGCCWPAEWCRYR